MAEERTDGLALIDLRLCRTAGRICDRFGLQPRAFALAFALVALAACLGSELMRWMAGTTTLLTLFGSIVVPVFAWQLTRPGAIEKVRFERCLLLLLFVLLTAAAPFTGQHGLTEVVADTSNVALLAAGYLAAAADLTPPG